MRSKIRLYQMVVFFIAETLENAHIKISIEAGGTGDFNIFLCPFLFGKNGSENGSKHDGKPWKQWELLIQYHLK